MSGESAVWKIKVFCNPDYFEWILCLTYKMICMPLRLISRLHSFFCLIMTYFIILLIEILLQYYVVINVT
jgi:hypothetical protein